MCGGRAFAYLNKMTSKGISENSHLRKHLKKVQKWATDCLGRKESKWQGPWVVCLSESRAVEGSAWFRAGGLRGTVRTCDQTANVGSCFVLHTHLSPSASQCRLLWHAFRTKLSVIRLTQEMMGKARLLNGSFQGGSVRMFTATLCRASVPWSIL